MNIEVHNNVHRFKKSYKLIVSELIKIRNEAGFTQQFMAGWLEVDRRKIIAFENLKKIDLEILLKYAYKLDIDLELRII